MTTYLVTADSLVRVFKLYRFKKDVPPGLRPFLKRVSFGLFGVFYVLHTSDGILCQSGEVAPVHIAYLVGVGPVIGLRDLEAAKHRKWAEAWRASYAAAINERLDLHLKGGRQS